MRKITTQFYDNHRQTIHEERKNDIAIVETRRERMRYYCFACRTTYRKSSIKPPPSQNKPPPLISPPFSGEESLKAPLSIEPPPSPPLNILHY